ncbi:MAG: ABC transporter permease [Gammaproteobacteria bacterium RBG_16_51_14]|nr:MAG: ABC transporter permease [Gammaproteobacteria bacterium RBG_16_51_14]
MEDIYAAFATAAGLILNLDGDLLEIIGVSLQVSLFGVGIAALVALPLGGAVALLRFPGRKILIVFLNALMGLPPVVVGLVVYLLLSRSGPLGMLGLLFTVTGMVIAQCLLVTPLIAALSRQVFEDLWVEYAEQLRSLGAKPSRAVFTLLKEGKYSLLTVVLAGFGRAIAEVGSVLIVGGNIAHYTRTMTTAIALETSKGDLALALALGITLIIIASFVNALAYLTKDVLERYVV